MFRIDITALAGIAIGVGVGVDSLMSREDPQLRSRIPGHLKESLEQKAKENKRTLTAEIVSRLEETVEQDFVIRNSNGFKEIVKNYNDLCEKYEELKAKDKREGVLLDLDSEELRSTLIGYMNYLEKKL